MNLWDLLWPGNRQSATACIGAGGKTALLSRLGREAIDEGRDLLLSVTTHWGTPRGEQPIVPGARRIVIGSGGDLPERYPGGVVVLSGKEIPAENKIGGVPGELFEALPEGYPTAVAIEADGSRRLPVKAPKPGEPALPEAVGQVVCLTGYAALGMVLSAETVHRWELFREVTGVRSGERFTPAVAARLFCHERGALAGTESVSRRLWVINGADDAERVARARRFAEETRDAILSDNVIRRGELPINPAVDKVAVTSLQSDEPVGYCGTGWIE